VVCDHHRVTAHSGAVPLTHRAKYPTLVQSTVARPDDVFT
jgi:hypothetical protein